MSLPDEQQLSHDAAELRQEVVELTHAYHVFLSRWKSIHNAEKKILDHVQKYTDDTSMVSVLHHIHSLDK